MINSINLSQIFKKLFSQKILVIWFEKCYNNILCYKCCKNIIFFKSSSNLYNSFCKTCSKKIKKDSYIGYIHNHKSCDINEIIDIGSSTFTFLYHNFIKNIHIFEYVKKILNENNYIFYKYHNINKIDIVLTYSSISFYLQDSKNKYSNLELNDSDNESNTELNNSDTELNVSDTELNVSDNESNLELNNSDIELNNSDIELNDSEIELNDSDIELNDSEIELNDSEIELNDSEI